VGRLTVLVIAPTSNLSLHEEIAAIATNHNAIMLQGEVTQTDIRQALYRHDFFDCLWFACHGGEAGIELGVGRILTALEIIQFVNVSRASLVVMNSCATEDLALQIASNGKTDVIYARGNTTNGEAVQLASLLARELTANQTYQEAFDIVKPPSGVYHHILADVSTRDVERNHQRDVTNDDLRTLLEHSRENIQKIKLNLTLGTAFNTGMVIVLTLFVVFLWYRQEMVLTRLTEIRQRLAVIEVVLSQDGKAPFGPWP
jgi:hypothetical protein